MKFKSFLLLLLLVASSSALAASRGVMDRPLMLGPHYPLIFMSSTYEPDSAFVLEPGEVLVQTSFTNLNTYVYSQNSSKTEDPNAGGGEFLPTDSTGYSVYFDGEVDRRFLRTYWGFSSGVELQLTYREIRFIKGNQDGRIEDFHKFFGLGNQGRENTDQNQLEIYIHDNQNDKTLFQITQESDKYHQESMTLGMKFAVRDTAKEALSFFVTSNFADAYIEREINEASDDRDHRNFNDYTYGLNYSSLFDSWSLHAGFSVASVGQSLFEDSPKEIYYFFLGSNWHLSDSFDWLFQVLEYSSPFPKDTASAIGADTREIATGLRWLIWEKGAFELGLLENQSQGPQNIDIAFFSNFMFSF